jgi:hypothetical protein
MIFNLHHWSSLSHDFLLDSSKNYSTLSYWNSRIMLSTRGTTTTETLIIPFSNPFNTFTAHLLQYLAIIYGKEKLKLVQIFGHLIAQNDKQNLKLHILRQFSILCTHIYFPSCSRIIHFILLANKCHATSLWFYYFSLSLWIASFILFFYKKIDVHKFPRKRVVNSNSRHTVPRPN